jgi:hypothetical protein
MSPRRRVKLCKCKREFAHVNGYSASTETCAICLAKASKVKAKEPTKLAPRV